MSVLSCMPIAKFFLDTSTSSITTAWKTVLTSATTDILTLEMFSATGTVLELGSGPGTASATSLNYYVIPGGQAGRLGLLINQNTNLFMRSVDANATTGLVIFNFMR